MSLVALQKLLLSSLALQKLLPSSLALQLSSVLQLLA